MQLVSNENMSSQSTGCAPLQGFWIPTIWPPPSRSEEQPTLSRNIARGFNGMNQKLLQCQSPTQCRFLEVSASLNIQESNTVVRGSWGIPHICWTALFVSHIMNGGLQAWGVLQYAISDTWWVSRTLFSNAPFLFSWRLLSFLLLDLTHLSPFHLSVAGRR